MNRIDTANQNDQVWFRGQAFHNDNYDPEFHDIAQRFLCGEVLAHGGLSAKQKALLSLAALTACQTYKPLPKYIYCALDIGATPEEIKETLYQCAPYIGLEKVQCALDEVDDVFQEASIKYTPQPQGTVSEETRLQSGLDVQKRIFGAANIDKMRAAAPPELQHIQHYLSAHCFGDFYTRGALDLQMRELITFCAICSLGGCEAQANAHAKANLNVGNTRVMLIDAITQCLPLIGFPRALNAIACINAATA